MCVCASVYLAQTPGPAIARPERGRLIELSSCYCGRACTAKYVRVHKHGCCCCSALCIESNSFCIASCPRRRGGGVGLQLHVHSSLRKFFDNATLPYISTGCHLMYCRRPVAVALLTSILYNGNCAVSKMPASLNRRVNYCSILLICFGVYAY